VIDGGFQITKNGTILFNIGVNDNPPNAATFYVPIQMGTGRSIVGVADPTNDQDVATKKYVDTKGNLNVAKAGDTMTGNLDMNGWRVTSVSDPTVIGDVANKRYVDAQDNLKVAKAGDTMTGNLTLNVGDDLLRTLGCSDLSGSKGFAILLGSIMNQIQCH
jgi:hypothetical protein